jgi:CRISPR-associated protein Csb2
MSKFLCFSVRYLNPVPAFHGRRDGGEPEWPPSPLRLFQALLDAAGTRWRNTGFQEHAKPAFVWLERLQLPLIIAPKYVVGETFRLSVPNNDMDSPAAAWARGQEPVKPHRPIDLRTMKAVCPTHLYGSNEEENVVHYLYSVRESCTEFDRHRGTLQAAANSVTHLGWGVDMAVADAKVVSQEEADGLPGERWQPVPVGGTPLRVPIDGTLTDLANKYERFLARLSNDGFKPVPPLSVFRVVGYQRASEPPPRPMAAFEIWKPLAQLAELPAGKSKFRPFDTPRHLAKVAGMVRHAAAEAAKTAGWSDEKSKTFILGHGDGEDGQATTNTRLMFLPLPSITPLKVESIRRLLLVGPPECREEVNKLRQLLSGRELVPIDSPDPIAMLSVIPSSDQTVKRYTNSASVWTTVTPMILPGYDDPRHLRRRLSESSIRADEQKRLWEKMEARIDDLVRKAIRHAGYSDELSHNAEIDWCPTGFRAGVDLASRFYLPEHLKKHSRYHVKITWRDSTGHPIRITGPIAIGGGRFGGVGLFAADDW